MIRAVVFGTGQHYQQYKPQYAKLYDIIAFVDNNPEKWGREFEGKPVLAPEKIPTLEYDVVLIAVSKSYCIEVQKQLLDMGIDKNIIRNTFSEDIYRHTKIFGSCARRKGERLVSSICRPSDLDLMNEWSGLQAYGGRNRKTWEWVYISQVLKERSMLQQGKKGLGFAVGREPLPSVFSSFGCQIMATDAPPSLNGVEEWDSTGQYCGSLNNLFYGDFVSENIFKGNVEFSHLDMNYLGRPEEEYDFLWSSCAIEHLGSIHRAKDFIYRSLDFLKPGGVAVHTTEYNISSMLATSDYSDSNIFRSIDLLETYENLLRAGHEVEPLDFRLDNSKEDYFIEYPSYFEEEHFKLLLNGYVSTSIGLIIYKTN